MKCAIVLGLVAICAVLIMLMNGRDGVWHERYTPSSCTVFEDSLLVDYQVDGVLARAVFTPDSFFQERAYKPAEWDTFEQVIFWLAPKHGELESSYYLVYDPSWKFTVAIKRDCFDTLRESIPERVEIFSY